MSTNIEKKYNDFWKEIVETTEGKLDKKAIMKELYDYSTIISSVAKVYCHATGGQVSMAHTDPDLMIALIDDYYEEQEDW